jgi:hypothetical protein
MHCGLEDFAKARAAQWVVSALGSLAMHVCVLAARNAEELKKDSLQLLGA